MFIEQDPPYEITRDSDGQHASREHIQVSVTPDLGEAKINHRVGQKANTGESTRWLHVDLKDKGVHLYISGSHVVLTAKAYLPTFDLPTPERLQSLALALMKPAKDERGRYIIDTPENRKVLDDLFHEVRTSERNRLFSWIRMAIAKLAES